MQNSSLIALWQEYSTAGDQAFDKRKYAESELQYLSALQEAEKFGDDDPRLALTLNNLAAAYHSQGKYSLAEPVYRRSLAIKEKIHGHEHPEVARNLHNLAVLFSAKRDYSQAEELYKQAIEIKEKTLGAHHADLVPVLRNYAQMLKVTKRPDECQQIEMRLETILKQP